jgi:uncharacterized membrane protein YgaE (UPF0421/DUF939 family)
MPRTADADRWYDAAWLERTGAWRRRATQASRNSAEARLKRWRSRGFFIAQCALTAGAAYFVAGGLLGHEIPLFSAIAAVIVLGQSFGQRLQRVAEVVAGVAVGVFVGDMFVHYAGSGYWQLAVVVFLAMSTATLLDASVGMTATAGTQSAVVAILVPPPGQAFTRWIDAVVGGLVALAAATITPASPVRRPRQQASETVAEMSAVLRDTAASLRARDIEGIDEAMERARASEGMLDDLRDVADDGLAVVRTSPFRRRHLPAVQVIADLLVPLDRAIRNLRVLVRRASIAVHTGEQVPGAYTAMVEELAEATDQMAGTLAVRELPESSRRALVELAERTTYVDEHPSLSSEVIRAQIRSMVVDLLMVTGMTYEESVECIPESFELVDGTEYEPELPGDRDEPDEPDERGDRNDRTRDDRTDGPGERSQPAAAAS